MRGIRKADYGPNAPAARGPNSTRVAAYLPNCEAYCVSARAIVCTSLITAVSFIFNSAVFKIGIAMDTMIKIIVMTTKSSIREKPRETYNSSHDAKWPTVRPDSRMASRDDLHFRPAHLPAFPNFP